jgi:hypothetical protein
MDRHTVCSKIKQIEVGIIIIRFITYYYLIMNRSYKINKSNILDS